MKRNSKWITPTVLAATLAFTWPADASRWAWSYGGNGYEELHAVAPTADGGYIAAGWTESFGGADYLVVKLAADGTPEWQRTYGGTRQDKAYAIQPTPDGGYIVAGWSNSFGSGDTSADMWILKLDADGSVVWQKRYMGAQYLAEAAYAVQPTADGGYIVAGRVNNHAGSGNGDIMLLKLDGGGTLQWQRNYSKAPDGSYSFDPIDDGASAVQQTRDGGYIVTGYTSFFGSGGVWRHHVWILKLDTSGQPQWNREFGASDSWDDAYAVRQTRDDGFVIAGRSNKDVLVIKLAADGATQWVKTYGGPGDDGARAIDETADGGFIVTGYYTQNNSARDVWLLRLDTGGNLLWQKTYGDPNHSETGYATHTLGDGGYILGAQGYGGAYNFWILKLDAAGEIDGDCSIGATPAPAVTEGSLGEYGQRTITDRWLDIPLTEADTGIVGISRELTSNEQCFVIQPPQIGLFSATPTTGNAPLSVDFTCSANGEETSFYDFDFGDGNVSSVPSESGTVSHLYTTPGVYQATCTAHDVYDQAVTSDPITITVNEPAPTWTDISDALDVTHSPRQLYDRVHRCFFIQVTVKNPGDVLQGPVRLVITDPNIPVKTGVGVGLEPDGFTEENDPYFILFAEGENFGAGEALEKLRINFELQRKRLDYGIKVEQLH